MKHNSPIGQSTSTTIRLEQLTYIMPRALTYPLGHGYETSTSWKPVLKMLLRMGYGHASSASRPNLARHVRRVVIPTLAINSVQMKIVGLNLSSGLNHRDLCGNIPTRTVWA